MTAILNTSGTAVAQYTYDAWGNILTTTGSMASTLGTVNPLRYRDYVYDQETGLYYLQSRYYNPKTGRFLNADDAAYLGADGTLLSYNLFAYCKNNPVIGYDPTGHFGLVGAIIATGAIVGGVLGAFNAAATGGNVLEAAIEGALTGLIGSTCGLLIANPLSAIVLATIGGAAIDFATQATSQIINEGSFDISRIDSGRVCKTAVQTGLGTAIPQLGNAKSVATDAFGTALIWAEGSTLISCADVVITNSTKSVTKQFAKRRGVSTLERKLLLT